jgi:hypothetical protein
MKRLRLRKLWEKRRADLLMVLIVALFFTLIFWRIIYLGEFFLAGDPLSYAYPLRTIASNMIRQGTLPLWTPLLLSGYPLLSMSPLGLGYPLTWGYLFIKGPWAEQIYILAPYLLAPAFTYAYARQVGRSRLASLFAGLSFGYGGLILSPIGLNGMLPNAMMWLPLVLIAIERARTRPFIPCLLLATAAYTMSVLTGLGQGFLYTGVLALAYGTFVFLFPKRLNEIPEDNLEEPDDWRKWRPLIVLSGLALVAQTKAWADWRRWRPLAVVLGAIVLASGVGGFQIMESLRAAESGLRGVLSYAQFTEGSFPFLFAFHSWLEPISSPSDVTLYVAPLSVGLSLAVIGLALRNPRREPLIFFWLVVAVVAWILVLGIYCPINQVVYLIPFINRFRVPSRHTFEWTFSMSILGAYGWDWISALIANRKQAISPWRQGFDRIGGLILLALCAVTGAGWWKSTDLTNQTAAQIPFLKGLNASYVEWKAAFALLTLAVIWQGWRITAPRWKSGFLLGALTLICFVEPFILITRWAVPVALPARRFDAVSPVTRFLQQYPPEQHRVFTQVNPFMETFANEPRIDPPNLTMLFGLQNINGYEPMIFKRYFIAMGNWDLNPTAIFGIPVPDLSIFDRKSHVLDLLNTSFVASYHSMNKDSEGLEEKEGIKFTPFDSTGDLPSGATMAMAGNKTEADQLVLVTSLTHSFSVAQGTPVARISIKTADDRTIERELRAGFETGESAYERADVRPHIRHALAPIFDSKPGDEDNSFSAHRYWSRLDLGASLRVETVEITKLLSDIRVNLHKASLYNTATGASSPLAVLDPDRWQQIYNQNGVWILRNQRALPRAWLVTEAEALDSLEVLRRIRGESKHTFDPRRAALIEIEPHKLPKLSGRPLAPGSFARIVNYEPNRLVIETNADQPTILVLSEIHYPGWVAMVDGVKTPIHTTNFLLRGVPLPAGSHRIEMSYRAPAARTGAIISLLTLLFIIGLAIYAKRSPAG